MSTPRETMRETIVALALSITAVPILVNAQPQSLSTINKDKSSNKSDLKDSIGDSKADVSQLISAVLKAGTDDNTGSNLSPVLGLPKAMPTKDVEIPIGRKTDIMETRRCFVVYETVVGAAKEPAEKRATCAYLVRTKRSTKEKETQFFRFDLTGKLEKIVLVQGKYDEFGKAVRGSGIKKEPDINSPEVKKTFDTEMKFWLKDWLKQHQNSAKKTVNAAKPAASPKPL